MVIVQRVPETIVRCPITRFFCIGSGGASDDERSYSSSESACSAHMQGQVRYGRVTGQ
jgi:hypothetical protein